jgi:secreted PhoX family phosphatase
MKQEISSRVNKRASYLTLSMALVIAMLAVMALSAIAATPYGPMMTGKNGYAVSASFTVGESIDGYTPTGILDGTGAYEIDENTVRVLVNHELNDDDGYAYSLANGTTLTGARVSYFDYDRSSREIVGAGPAYDKVYDRQGRLVTDPLQINEGDYGTMNGFSRFCSAQGVSEGEYGFVNDIFFTNEETSSPSHPHGGSVWAIDVDKSEIWAAPKLGRGAWENVTPLDTGTDEHVAFLLGDDSAPAPLYLYIGRKDAIGDGSFLDRNGLAEGSLFVWKTTESVRTPEEFNGTGSVRQGKFIPIKAQNEGLMGKEGYDAQGYLDDVTLRALAENKGAFFFSRPEDLHTNPADGTQAVMASTGRGQLYPSDNWGTTYLIDVEFKYNQGRGNQLNADAILKILHDADDYGDFGVRSADNLVWSENGYIYIQEDRSTSPSLLFGADSGREASIWKIDPATGAFTQVAEMDRSAVAPAGSTDGDPDDLGDWESSGILDVTDLFETAPGETLLLGTVQAHSIRDGLIGGDTNLVQGGQLIFVSNK